MRIPRLPSDLFPSTVHIYRPVVEAEEGSGDWSRILGAPVGTAKGRLSKARYSGSIDAWSEAGLVDVPTFKAYLPAGADVVRGDALVFDGDGERYEVLEVYRAGDDHHLEVYVRRGY